MLLRSAAVRRFAALLCLGAAFAMAGCGDDDRGDGVRVVATTTQLGEFARAVGGSRVAVHTILRANTDPHAYEPRPSDARAIYEADLAVQSGGEVDGWLKGLVDEAGGDARTVDVQRAIGAQSDDPHWWQDPRNAERAVGVIRDALTEADPAGRGAFAAAASRYLGRLRALDAAIVRCYGQVPRAKRTMVTSHDAFGWFARRYGVTVLGSVIPSLSSAAQPSAGDIEGLVRRIREAGVTTIFPEAALNQRLEEAVARDAGAKVGPVLYADALGPADSPGGTYLGALAHDAAAIGAGFGARCELPR